MVRSADMSEPPTPIAIAPFELEAQGDPLFSDPLFSDPAGRVLAWRRPFGLGRVAVTLLSGSYRWVLEGRPDAHRAYWQSLIEGVAPSTGTTRWLLPSGPLFPHEPIVITLAADSVDGALLLEPDGREATVAMRQHPSRLQRWTATIWPRSLGWHQLRAGETLEARGERSVMLYPDTPHSIHVSVRESPVDNPLTE